MILNVHHQTPHNGIQHTQAWIDPDDGWLYIKSSLRPKAMKLVDVMGRSGADVGRELAEVYNQELGYTTHFLRCGTTLQILATLFRMKTEDPE